MDSVMIISITLGYLLGTYLFNTRKMKLEVILSLGSFISLLGFLLSSFSTTWAWFLIFYGFFIGIGCGMMYFPPLQCSWEYFPTEKRGLITGIVFSGMGVGQMLCSLVSFVILNPHDPINQIDSDDTVASTKDQIAYQVPYMFRALCSIWAVLCLVAITLIKRPENAGKTRKKQTDLFRSDYV
jgi:MFS family permease